MRLILIVTVAAALGAAACTNAVGGAGQGPDLPIARLACPDHAVVGEPFVVDGSESIGPDDAGGGFASTTISMAPGDQTQDALSANFTAARDGVATVRLVVTDKAGNVAEARCRIVVDEAVHGGEGEGEGEEGEGEGEGDVDGGDPVDLTGTFALLAYDLPMMQGSDLDPATQCGAGPSLSVVDIRQDGTHVTMSSQYCWVGVPNVQVQSFGIQQTDLQPVVNALAPMEASFDLASATTGASFAPPLDQVGEAVVVGAALDDPEGDALPVDGNDPRVTDDDADGWPAVSVSRGGNVEDIIYRRQVRSFEGVVVDADTVEGAVPGSFQVDGEASVVGSFLGAFTVPVGVGLPSTFRMVRVDEGATCDDVVNAAAGMMEAFPPADIPDGCAAF